MKQLVLLAALAAASLAADEPTNKASGSIDTGTVLVRIVQGGGWSTEIQAINTNDEGRAMPYTISFFGTTGEPRQFNVRGPGVNGDTRELARVVNNNGVDIFELPNIGELRAGYGTMEVAEFRGVSVNVVLTQSVPGRPDFQATIPALGRFQDDLRMVYRNTRPFTTVVALTAEADEDWTFRAYNANGSLLCEATRSLQDGEHFAFVLQDVLGCTAGRDGMLEMFTRFGGAATGLIFHDFGPFTAQVPYEICCIDRTP